jgi:hypothetical protein
MSKKLVIGNAMTGAKFTPANHPRTQDENYNDINIGANIPVAIEEILAEAQLAYAAGCRYFHVHSRDPGTREQDVNQNWYKEVSRGIRSSCPGAIISFGSSRNGGQVHAAIDEKGGAEGEWKRSKQAGIALSDGGAHFQTVAAAVELSLIRDAEKRYKLQRAELPPKGWDKEMGEAVECLSFEANPLTASRSDYGYSSPQIQYTNLKRTISARDKVGLGSEVEWTQFPDSKTLTEMAVRDMGLGGKAKQLSIVILFGFSPKLPIPKTYEEFKKVVDAAKALEIDPVTGEKRLDITITVGAPVLPQNMKKNSMPLDKDIDPNQPVVGAIERITAYAAQADSGVDVLRSGMEDTPYMRGDNGGLLQTTNPKLVEFIAERAQHYGAQITTDAKEIAELYGFTNVTGKKIGSTRTF